MHRLFIAVWFLVIPLSDQNLISDTNLNESFSNSSSTDGFHFFRCQRSMANKPNKPMDCRRLHATEDTPFIAIILNQASGRLVCMGSIIDERHILTAYKCIQNTNPKSLRILVGYFKAYWGQHSQVLFVDRILKHEHELVILKLKRAIVFHRNVRAIRLLRLGDAKEEDAKEGEGQAQARAEAQGGGTGSKAENRKTGPEAGKGGTSRTEKGGSESEAGKKGEQLNTGKGAKRSEAEKGAKGSEAGKGGLKRSTKIIYPDKARTSKAVELGSNKRTRKKLDNAFGPIDGQKYEFYENYPPLKLHDENKSAVLDFGRIDTASKIHNSKKRFFLFDNETGTEYNGSKNIKKRIFYGLERNKDDKLQSSSIDFKVEEKQKLTKDGNNTPAKETPAAKTQTDGKQTDGKQADKKPGDGNQADKKPGDGNQADKKPAEGESKDEPQGVEMKSFSETHSSITEFLLVGFPLSNLDAVGDSISQTLVYSMKEEKLKGTDCLKFYQDKPSLTDKDDPNNIKRIFCTDGASKFCWGCLGGPTLFKKDQEYIQAGVVGGASCDKDGTAYLHIRVDINMKWIAANSLIAEN